MRTSSTVGREKCGPWRTIADRQSVIVTRCADTALAVPQHSGRLALTAVLPVIYPNKSMEIIMSKNSIIVAAIATLASLLPSGAAIASSGQFSGTWKMSIDFNPDGSLPSPTTRLLSTSSHFSRFIASYSSISNDSIFQGETFFDPARTTKLISIVQTGTTYYAIYVGREIAANRFEGTWYDNNGNVGDFRFEQ